MENSLHLPDHVPAHLVRDFDIDFRGPLDELYPRLDALRDEGRVLWLRAGEGTAGGFFGQVPGTWTFTRADDIREALQRPDMFSSRLGDGSDIPAMIPIFLDPPDHTRYRDLLNPLFSFATAQKMESSIRERIRGIVDSLVDEGSCDFVADVAVQFPTRVFTSWIGLPEEETSTFVGLVSTLIHGQDDNERAVAIMGAVGVLNELIADRLASRSEDLMSQIIAQQLDGRRLTHDELMSIAFLLFLAGLDTVAAALSFSFWHLAQVPEDRRAIAAGTVPVERAVEELLRRHSFVNLPRLVARDMDFAGVQLKKGDPVVIVLALAGRDPDDHGEATDVKLDRPNVRHSAFGGGPHRCLGAHLARVELRVALQEWHSRIPGYELAGDVSAYAGTVMGVTSLPLRW